MVRTSKETLSGRVANSETQVLNKRKPVNLIAATPDVPDNVEVRYKPSWRLRFWLTRAYQVYVMKGTNEVFTDYEKYLKRYAQTEFVERHSTQLILAQLRLAQSSMLYLHVTRDLFANALQKKFTDAVNGKSGLTYWDALESEVNGSCDRSSRFNC